MSVNPLGVVDQTIGTDLTGAKAKAANSKAGQQSELIGMQALDMANAGINRALDQTLPAARQWERTYGAGGVLGGPGQFEQLYEERRMGMDPAAERQRLLGTQAIDNAFSARGLQNSGAALKAVGNLNADIAADQFRQLGDMAGRAQGATETRLGGAFDRLGGLGTTRAGIVQGGVQGGINSYTTGKMGGVNAKLANAQVDTQRTGDMLKMGGMLAGGM